MSTTRPMYATVLLLALGVAGVRAEPAESAVVKAARGYIECLAKDDFTAAAATLNDALRKTTTAEHLRDSWKRLLEFAGGFQKQLDARFEVRDKAEIVTVTCQFKNERLDLRVRVDAGGRVGGFDVGPDARQAGSDFKTAVTLAKQGKCPDAIKILERLLRVELFFGKEGLDFAGILLELGRCHSRTGKFDLAEGLFLESVRIQRDKLGADHPDVAVTLNDLGLLNQDLGRPAKAESYLRDSLKIMEAKKGPNGPEAARIRCNLAGLLHSEGRYAQAEPLYGDSLKVLESTLPPDHPDVTVCRDGLAVVYRALGQAGKGEELYQRALRRLEETGPSNQVAVALLLIKLGVFRHAAGQYAPAESAFRRSLAIWNKQAPESLDAAFCLNDLAAVLRVTGNYPEAERFCQRARRIQEAKLPADHPDIAATLNTLALIYKVMGQYERAETLYRRSIEILRKAGRDKPRRPGHRTGELGMVLDNLAGVYRSMGQPDRAEALLLEGLGVLTAELGTESFDVAVCRNNLAEIYRSTGRYEKAEEQYRASLKLLEARWPTHPFTAVTCDNLGYLYQCRGDFKHAEPLHRRALAILEPQVGPDNPDHFGCRASLAILCEATGRTGEAADLTDRARRGAAVFVGRALPALSEQEQLQFVQARHETAFSQALSLGLRHPDDPGLTARSAAWLLNGKAVAQEALAGSVLLGREVADKDVRAVARELLNVRQQLAQRISAHAPERPPAHPQDLRALADREQDLARRLSRANFRSGRDVPWVEPAELARRLPAGTAYVDIARFDVFDFQARPGGRRWGPARYVAWITTRDRPTRLIDLGPADDVDRAVRVVREALRQARVDIGLEGEANAETGLRRPLDALSRLVLQPLLKHLAGCHRWVISPDGNLWLVPWAALTLPDAGYVVEKYEVRHMVSGRELVLPADRSPVPPAAPLVLADPDYDLGAVDARAEETRLAPADPSGRQPPGPSRGRADRYRRLENSAAEARAIVPHLAKYAGAEPRVYLQKQALETVFKASPSPRVEVLSTHGYFDADDAPQPEAGPGPQAAVRGNPLLRCGLVFAGYNHRVERPDGDDGVLTGLEVVGTDLRGTELVVLSACETGLGDVRNGEGVAGLRQAFQLAGAGVVMATLWQIPDRESADLMGDCFDRLGRGADAAAALRAAQLRLIATRRRDHGAAHPYYWAAFTVTGIGDRDRK